MDRERPDGGCRGCLERSGSGLGHAAVFWRLRTESVQAPDRILVLVGIVSAGARAGPPPARAATPARVHGSSMV